MNTFSGAKPSQRPDELRRFIDILQDYDCMSYLEIGARHGDTFHAVMSSLPKGAFGVAVDLPGAAWGTSKSAIALYRAEDDLRKRGYDVHVVQGDSKQKKTRDAVFKLLKAATTVDDYVHFHACLIDADHRYDAVLRDFNNFALNTQIVALHDIDGHGVVQKRSGLPVEVPQAWAEIKARGCYRTEEIIGSERGMGIGVVYMTENADPEGADDAD